MEIIHFLTNDQEQWKINSEGQVVNFKAKGLLYIPKVWHHYITSKILPTTNICEVIRERAIVNYVILQNIKFDVGKIIKEDIWDDRDVRKNLGYPFLIYQLCMKAGVEPSKKKDWLHLIKSIVVKNEGKSRVPQPERIINLSNESTSEEEEEQENQPPPLQPSQHPLPIPHDENTLSSAPRLHD